MTNPVRGLRPPLGTFLLTAVWFGFVAGLLELGAQAARKLIWHELLFVSRDVLWMAPLADAGLLLAVAVVLAVLGVVIRPLRALPSIAFLGAGAATAGVLLLFPAVHWAATAVVAVAAGLQVGKLAKRRPQGLARLVRRSVWWLVALVAALGAGERGWRWLEESRAVQRLGAPRAGAPNVLLLVMDTVRAESLELYGHAESTAPRLHLLATQAATFDRAFSTAPWTLPSHASMLTGRFHHELSCDWADPLDDAHPTLAEVLAAQGWATGGFVGNLNYCSYEVGLSRGFSHYCDYPVSLGQVVLSTSLGRAITNSAMVREAIDYHDNLNRKPAAVVNDEFLRWLDGVGDRPWFAFLNYYDAHGPYLPPPEFDPLRGSDIKRGRLRYDTNLIEVDDWSELSPEQIAAERDSYHGTIRWLDAAIGALLDELERRGVLDNTVVIVVSDHGEQFGEHGLYDHGNSLYTQNVHVPLLIRYTPRLAGGTRVPASVCLSDIPATVLDLVGVDDPGGLPGQSIVRHADRVARLPTVDDGAPDLVLSQATVTEGKRTGVNHSVLVGTLHYIKTPREEELYDIASDPLETVDLVLTKAGRDVVPRLRALLEAALKPRRD